MLLQSATDEELLEAHSPADAGEAFAEFYRRHERVVLAFHMRRVRHAEVAADLAATTFVEALAGRHRFRNGGAGNAAAWLFGIASHVISRHMRSASAEARRYDRLKLELPALTDAQAAEIEQLCDEGPLLEALDRLPEQQRDAVRAYVLTGHTYDEIAEHEAIEPATARKRVSRGLAVLRANHKETR